MRSRTLEVNNLANHSSADRSLFRGLLMTACDLGAITKPWPIQKKVIENSKKFIMIGLSKEGNNTNLGLVHFIPAMATQWSKGENWPVLNLES